ncbi:molybdopterin synthase sulfur carrier subunit [Tenuifilaceae bacterium CYCD]|nr:molybdopterin synthase sulfur carrier subunit [Tenuifilaceae bacterium CYCD]
MQVKVKLFATLREGREKEQLINFLDAATPADIFEKLNIPATEVAILFVNGRDCAFDQSLKDGDTVSIFPPVGGG